MKKKRFVMEIEIPDDTGDLCWDLDDTGLQALHDCVLSTMPQNNMKRLGKYNWKNQPEKLIYVGKKGAWHQFVLVESPFKVWSEVLDEDLHMLEETND